MQIKIREISTASLSCEPLIKRTKNGELLCVCQQDGLVEPSAENRVYVFHSKDNGETWSKRERILPENGRAVYATELSVMDDEITAYLTLHAGGFLDWDCVMMKSYDNGYTWQEAGAPPFFPAYTFFRSQKSRADGTVLLPYQSYPVTPKERDRVMADPKKNNIAYTQTPYCENGVLMSKDGGRSYERVTACKIDTSMGWSWCEPTIAFLSDGGASMLMRREGNGRLWRCDSPDGGLTWGEAYRTDIPNPTSKPFLLNLDAGRIALLHTPNDCGKGYGRREPLEVWISDDDMKSWGQKIRLTDFPGEYHYADGFYENGHILFVIEHNRHTILFFDVAL